jgi:hypothetical protein
MKSVNQYVMKDSGVQWIGQVPKHWEVCRLGIIFKENVILNTEKREVNALQFKLGEIISKSKGNSKYIPISLSGYNIVEPNVIMINGLNLSFDFISQRVALVKERGVITSTYIAIAPSSCVEDKNTTSRYVCYLLKAYDACKVLHAMGRGLRAILSYSVLSKIPIYLPPLSEQRAIADWLDAKCADIDAAIELQQRMIDKLKVYKTAVIHQAVTKGLDKNLKPTDLKDSGIKWLGMIPKHWDVVLVKNILRWKSVKGCGEKEVLSLYREYGVIPKSSRDDNHNITSDNTDDYKLVEKGDFVINKMKAWQGSMGVSLYEGIISPAYYVCSFINEKVYKPYFHYLMRDSSYLPEYKRLSGGIRVGQWDLAYDKFKSLPALLPPILAEQRAIADWLDAKCADIDATIALKEQKQEKLKAYKKTIIFEYVTGKKQVANINKQL